MVIINSLRDIDRYLTKDLLFKKRSIFPSIDRFYYVLTAFLHFDLFYLINISQTINNVVTNCFFGELTKILTSVYPNGPRFARLILENLGQYFPKLTAKAVNY